MRISFLLFIFFLKKIRCNEPFFILLYLFITLTIAILKQKFWPADSKFSNNLKNFLSFSTCEILFLGGHSKSTFAQDSRVLTPPPPCSPLIVFEPSPTSLKVRSFWLGLPLSHSISILLKFREKRLIMSNGTFCWAQRVF